MWAEHDFGETGPAQHLSCLLPYDLAISCLQESSPFLSLGGRDLHIPPGMGLCHRPAWSAPEWFRNVTTFRLVRSRLGTLLEASRKGHSLWVVLVVKQGASLKRESKQTPRPSYMESIMPGFLHYMSQPESSFESLTLAVEEVL